MDKETQETILLDWRRLKGRKKAMEMVADLNGCSVQQVRRVVEEAERRRKEAETERRRKEAEAERKRHPPKKPKKPAQSEAVKAEEKRKSLSDKPAAVLLEEERILEQKKADRMLVEQLILKGELSAVEIAQETGRSVIAVRQKAYRMGKALPRCPYGLGVPDGQRKRAIVPEAAKKAAVERYLNGETRKQVAESLGVERTTISRWAYGLGRARLRDKPEQSRQELDEMILQGSRSCGEIVQALGYNEEIVRRRAKLLGVRLPRSVYGSCCPAGRGARVIFTQRQREEAVRRCRDGEKRSDVAQSLGIRTKTLNMWFYLAKKREVNSAEQARRAGEEEEQAGKAGGGYR